MPIYNIFEEKQEKKENLSAHVAEGVLKKDRFFSALTARVLFFLLLVADLLWLTWSTVSCALFATATFITFGRLPFLSRLMHKHWTALKRSAVCGIALFIALFSPALGIMIACTYFLMYDKTGIQEVVPTSLQDQFQEFMK